ncbi:sensor histidine kinase [Pseudofrankia inefficax]|nr:histidine kinase [Pseudofrankia inefficax]
MQLGASRDRLADALIGVAAAAGLLVDHALSRPGDATTPWQVLIAVVTGLALAGRRRLPVTSFAVTVTLVLLGLPMLHATRAAVTTTMVAAATIAHQGPRKISVVVGLALVPCVGLGVVLSRTDDAGWATFVAYTVVVLAAVAAGDAWRWRQETTRARAAALQARQAADAQARYDANRLRLARDLHDSVGHALVAINTQAGVAAHLHSRDADPGLVDALREIKLASAVALDELRATVRALRTDVRGTTSGSPLAMEAGSALTAEGIEALSRPLRAQGLVVEIVGSPATAAIPAGVAEAGYRIVQESLTNVLRHASATRVRVELDHGPDAVGIVVHDDGLGRSTPVTPKAGHGLVGMTERAEALGGTLTAGPGAGGWLVRARLPAVPPAGVNPPAISVL